MTRVVETVEVTQTYDLIIKPIEPDKLGASPTNCNFFINYLNKKSCTKNEMNVASPRNREGDKKLFKLNRIYKKKWLRFVRKFSEVKN